MSGFYSRRRRLHGSNRIVLLSTLSKFLFFGLIGFIVVIFGLFLWYGRDLPTPGKLVSAQQDQSTRIFDRSGILLYSVYQKDNRVYIPLSQIPQDLQHATISIEDKNFYQNAGFSPISYLRVLKDFVLHGQLTGGSGLTQQLVKNSLLQTNERTLPRKIKELILAIQVDKKYSKDQILEMYLNDVPYGGSNIGVEAAAESYFGKHAKDLDLAQSAFLAGLPQGPTLYSPYSGNKYYLGRSQDVLNSMVSNGYISQKQDDDAYKEIKAMQFSGDKDGSMKAAHFVLYVKNYLENTLHFSEQQIDNGGLQVTTTLDYTMQKQAEDIVKEEIGKLKGYDVGNGAAVVTNPKTGEVLTMVGSKDYFGTSEPKGCDPAKTCVFTPNVNAAIANRQPGSSLKPIIYATAFEKGYTPATMIMDVKTDFPNNDDKKTVFTPVNYDGKDHGPQQIRFALGNSLNIPAVKTLARVGLKDAMQNAYNMGLNNLQPTADAMANVGLSLVLGGRETTLLDETTAYGVFATGGMRHDPVFVLKVTDSKGNVLYQAHPSDGQQVMPENVCFLISHILLDNNARLMDFGPNSWLVVPGKTVSVKTGTTDDKRDNWTVGYTPSYVVGVWVGNNDNSSMNQAISSGITGASPIWNRIMSMVLKGKPDEVPKQPSDVIAVTIDALGGGLPVAGQSTRSEYFIKGTEPTAPAAIYQEVKLSKHQQGKLANQGEIDAHDYDTKAYIVFHEDDPVSQDGKNRWQDAINTWLQTNYVGQDQYHPPTDVSDYNESNNNNPTETPTPTPTPTPN